VPPAPPLVASQRKGEPREKEGASPLMPLSAGDKAAVPDRGRMRGYMGFRVGRSAPHPSVGRAALHLPPPRGRQGGAVPFRASAMPWKGLRPLPPLVISRPSVSLSVIPTERSERRDPQGHYVPPQLYNHKIQQKIPFNQGETQ